MTYGVLLVYETQRKDFYKALAVVMKKIAPETKKKILNWPDKGLVLIADKRLIKVMHNLLDGSDISVIVLDDFNEIENAARAKYGLQL